MENFGNSFEYHKPKIELPLYEGDNWSKRCGEVGGAHPSIMETESVSPVDIFRLNTDQLDVIKSDDQYIYESVRLLQDSGLNSIDGWWGLSTEKKNEIIRDWGLTIPDSFLDKIAFKIGLEDKHRWLDAKFIGKIASASSLVRYYELKESVQHSKAEPVEGVNYEVKEVSIDDLPFDPSGFFQSRLQPAMEAEIGEFLADWEGIQEHSQELESILNINAIQFETGDLQGVEKEILEKYLSHFNTYYSAYMHLSELYINGISSQKTTSVSQKVKEDFMLRQSKMFHEIFSEIIQNKRNDKI